MSIAADKVISDSASVPVEGEWDHDITSNAIVYKRLRQYRLTLSE